MAKECGESGIPISHGCGQVDRKALPAPPESFGEGSVAVVAPRGPLAALESRIREVWAEVLDKEASALSVEARVW